MKVLQGKTVIVTGGSAGIGRAAALRFAEEGAQVLVTGRREAPLQELADSQPNIEYLVADAARPEDAARAVDAATGRWGRLDILVNNAGAGKVMPLAQANAQDMADIFAVNV
ncbi:MAG TPA: SDR family NAD(P)-dependent oxidoreductase, partial [Gallionella sp.]|nr:SDR family NAD(P)-dependent oxidoreductase [Gallionella sp.]